MEPTLFREKTNLLKKKNGEVAAFWDARDAKQKEGDPPDLTLTADDKKFLDGVYGEIKELTAEVEEFKEWQTVAGRAEAVGTVLGQPVGRPGFANTDPANQNGQRKSAGREFVESAEIKNWIENELGIKGPGASIADKMRIDGPAVDVKGLILTSATSGGAFVRRDYDENVELPLRLASIRDVITVGRTGSNLVEYVRQTSKTRAAAIVPEATGTSGGGYTAAAKPEASMAYEIVQAGVKTIAVWMPITRQILADAPQLESEIDGFEREDLELALEEQIISGTGGTQFTGLENTAGLTPQAFATDMLTTTRKARTAALITGRAKSTGFLLSPYDWETLDLTKDAENRYYFGGPLTLGTKMLWGLPVVESEVIPQGTGYTGNLKLIRLWDREQATRRITDSHSDFFTHNLIAILTELRAAMGVKRPAGIVKIDLHAGANS